MCSFTNVKIIIVDRWDFGAKYISSVSPMKLVRGLHSSRFSCLEICKQDLVAVTFPMNSCFPLICWLPNFHRCKQIMAIAYVQCTIHLFLHPLVYYVYVLSIDRTARLLKYIYISVSVHSLHHIGCNRAIWSFSGFYLRALTMK